MEVNINIKKNRDEIVEKLKKELIEQGRVAEIPEGYSWCMECDALTPRKPGKYIGDHPGRCIICGSEEFGELCPNCGWDCEEVMEGSDRYQEVLHHEGCHCKPYEEENFVFSTSWSERIALDFRDDWMKPAPDRVSWSIPPDREWRKLNLRLYNQWVEARNVKCGCPRYTCYRNLNVFDAWSSSVYHPDCYNAVEFGFTIRCPKCGCIWSYSDGNC